MAKYLNIVLCASLVLLTFFPLPSTAQSLAEESHKKAQIETARLLQKLGTAVDEYIKQHPDVGPPQVQTVAELVKLLSSENLISEYTPTVDGWFRDISYWQSAESKSYSLRSLGSDGVRSKILREEIPPGTFWMDIYWANGKFEQAPAEFMEEKEEGGD